MSDPCIKCGSCGRFEWNNVLEARQCICAGCRAAVALFAPKTGGSYNGGGKGGSKGSSDELGGAVVPSTGTAQTLDAALQVAKVPAVRLVLERQAKQAKAEATAPAAVPVEEAVRKAAGACKDAATKHQQATEQVKRCKVNLQRAMGREE